MSSQTKPESIEDQDEYTAVFANGRGFLTYWVPPGRDVVVLLRLVWVGD
jgi:hypothetical protein